LISCLLFTKLNLSKKICDQTDLICDSFCAARMERRSAIIELHSKGKSCRQIAECLKHLKVSKSMVAYTIKKFRETQTVSDRPRAGRPRSVRTKKLIKITKTKIARNNKRSINKMASEASVSRRTMQRIVREDLGLKAYKLQKRQLLSEATKAKRLARCKWLLQWIRQNQTASILWTDEKLFTVEAVHNHQNDRILSRDIGKVPVNEKTVFRRQKPASVMVWAGVSSCGRKSPLIFIPEGVKVNQYVYKDMLTDKVLPWVQEQAWESSFCFQQDGAPSHTANSVQQWCRENFEAFWDKDSWPSSSPDLNVMDFSI